MATATEPLITWSADFEGNLDRARNTGKHVLLDFSAAPMCTGCARMESDVYSNAQVASFIKTHFVPVRVHVKEQKDEFARLGERFGSQWTPAIILTGTSGTEIHRIEGFLAADEFLAQLILGVGKAAFAEGRFPTAEERFRDVVDQHAFTDAAPEALYWAGVSKYKATNDPRALKETADALEKYPDSSWAQKASVWKPSISLK